MFRFFRPFNWFNSEERKQKQEALEKMLQEKAAIEVQQPVINQEEDLEDGYEEDDDYDNSDICDNCDTNYRPFSSLRLTGTTLQVVLNDGEVLTKENCTAEDYDNVVLMEDADEVEEYFIGEVPVNRNPQYSREAIVETEDEKRLVLKNKEILRYYSDFSFGTDDIFMEGINLPMPATVAGSFIELCERMELEEDHDQHDKLVEQYEALKMFWYWTALNPIEASRRDLLSFVRNNDIKITRNGLLEMYRRVVSVGRADKEFIDFVSYQYYRVKRNFKEPDQFRIVEEIGGTMKYSLERVDTDYTGRTIVGNLDTLYNQLPQMKENAYTDNHTRTKSIKIGEVYKEDEDKIDLDNTQSCSAGLHVGSHSFMFSGFGDVGVLALVNPSKVRSVPINEGNKMRVSEMFIAATVDLDEYKESINDSYILDYSDKYFTISVEELKEKVTNKDFGSLACQDRLPALSMLNIEQVMNILRSKVTEI